MMKQVKKSRPYIDRGTFELFWHKPINNHLATNQNTLATTLTWQQELATTQFLCFLKSDTNNNNNKCMNYGGSDNL